MYRARNRTQRARQLPPFLYATGLAAMCCLALAETGAAVAQSAPVADDTPGSLPPDEGDSAEAVASGLTTKRTVVGKLIGQDLAAGKLQLLLEDRYKVLVVVDEKTKVMVKGMPATLDDLQRGDIVRIQTSAPGSRYAVELHAARDKTNPPPGASNIGTIGGKKSADSVKKSSAKAEGRSEMSSGLGVGLLDSPQQGVLVIRVQKDSPAERSGLSMGDYVIAFNGKQVETPDQFLSLIEATPPNEKVTLNVWRNRKREKLVAVLTMGSAARDYEVDDGEFSLALFSDQMVQPWFGVSVGAAGNDSVEVIAVDSGSPADEAGILPGDLLVSINGVSIQSPRQLDLVLDRFEVGSRLDVEVSQHKKLAQFQVVLGEPQDAKRRSRHQTHSGDAADVPASAALRSLQREIENSRLTAEERREATEAIDTLRLRLLPQMP